MQIFSIVILFSLIYIILEDLNEKYAKALRYILITFFFIVALQILSSIIAQISAVFLQFQIEQQYVASIIRLIGIVYFSEFISVLLAEAKLSNVSTIVNYIVKLVLIGYSLPILMTLFELILSIL